MAGRKIERARKLRRTMTLPEVLLWTRLRGTELHIRRQHPEDRFFTDFFCGAARMVIEVDGEIHKFQTESDAERDGRSRRIGLRTWRIPAAVVLHDPDAVAEAVLARLRARVSGEEPMP